MTSPNVAFREGVLPVLSALLERLNATRSTLTLLSHVSSDAEESQIKHLFLKSGLYSKGLDPRRVLFCDSGEGLTHMVRHLSPGVHVDSVGSVSQKRMEDLQMFVPTLVCVDRRHPGRTESSSSTEMSPTPSASSPPRILSLDSFDQILQLNTL